MPRVLTTLPPLVPTVHLRRSRAPMPYPLAEPGCRVFQWGRSALFAGVTALRIPAGAGVLVPAYHHGSEVEALVRAGLTCRFYEGTPDLEPDPDELERLLDPNTRALHLTHYLGFPQDARRWRNWCDQRGLLLIEDAAQAWLSSRDGRPVGSWGDVTIYCLYKSIAVPDGGAVWVRAAAVPEPGSGRSALREAADLHIAWFDRRSPRRGGAGGGFDPEEEFGLGDPNAGASTATRYLLPRLARSEVAELRRANYERLLGAAPEIVPAPFDVLPDGAAPFMFPIETDDKLALIARLARQGIVAVDMWAYPHPALDPAGYPRVGRRRRMTVALPVHQELRRTDLERIAAALQREVNARSGEAVASRFGPGGAGQPAASGGPH